MEETVSIKDIMKIMLKRWKLIILITLLFTSITGVISFYFITPIYNASTQLLVNQRNSENQLDFTRLQSNVELINTYRLIIKSPIILDKVIEELKLEQSEGELYESINVKSFEGSQIILIEVENSSPDRAVEIANSIASNFQQEIKNIMSVDNVSILTKAKSKEEPLPIKPKPIVNIAIGIVIGIMVGIGLSCLFEFLDKTIKTSDDIDIHLGIPVLGIIPKMPRGTGKGKASKKNIVLQRAKEDSVEI
ncbi:YveK family protein [Cytobacillus praedii]|uniref:Capsule biosynthesis protein n=1 Tax=Cytobacillus praedii TaxID=1742358 RepID=A0A4R1AYT4_9BACI|nr:Wzz/FepE/Etk N-terminal domain-containing protein [Cytobacillus praedii]MED3550865.1 Wzz/FepE/Etk N-terminal domain-containing protein [Cytobacillus praedii]TCJ05768.1 capsule biosynthesis protein [Cytobacillus praedii]